jgi:hypothetical protein
MPFLAMYLLQITSLLLLAACIKPASSTLSHPNGSPSPVTCLIFVFFRFFFLFHFFLQRAFVGSQGI